MKFDYIKSKLLDLGYSKRDIEILISVKNENLLKKYFYGQGIREYKLITILKKSLKKPFIGVSSVSSYTPEENEENEGNEICLEVTLRHDFTGSISVYGTSYSTYHIRMSSDFYVNSSDREIRNYINNEIDYRDLDPENPCDYDTCGNDVYWDENGYETEIDDFEEIEN